MLFIASCSTTSNKEARQLELDLVLQTSNKNKEIIIESLLKKGIKFSVNFENKGSYLLGDDLLNSNLKFFCKSFIQEQRDALESAIFQDRKENQKRVLIVYSADFKEIANNLNKKSILNVCTKNPTWISDTATALSAIEKMNTLKITSPVITKLILSPLYLIKGP